MQREPQNGKLKRNVICILFSIQIRVYRNIYTERENIYRSDCLFFLCCPSWSIFYCAKLCDAIFGYKIWHQHTENDFNLLQHRPRKKKLNIVNINQLKILLMMMIEECQHFFFVMQLQDNVFRIHFWFAQWW